MSDIQSTELSFGRYAAIDIGTVTCRMLVADVDEAGIHELGREYAITNLGEGVDATGTLKPEAIERVVSTVGRFLAALRGYEERDGRKAKVLCIATSASRDASNADDFADALANLGVTLTVIPGNKEAALSFAGASCDFPGEKLFVVDVGGGSTEVIAGVAGEGIVASHSFDIGCRRITERFFAADPPSPVDQGQASTWVRGEMSAFFDALSRNGFVPDRMVAVAGTATSVVAVREQMEVYDTARVHRAQVDADEVVAMKKRFVSLPLEQRAALPGLDPGRAPVIVAGMIILEQVLGLAGTGSFTVSETDILHGIILDAARKDAVV